MSRENCFPRYKGKDYSDISIIKNLIAKEIAESKKTGVPVKDIKSSFTGLTLDNKNKVVDFLFNNIMQKISGTEELSTKDLDALLSSSFEDYLQEVKSQDPEAFQALLNNKQEILGIGMYKDGIGSVRRHLALFLGVNKTKLGTENAVGSNVEDIISVGDPVDQQDSGTVDGSDTTEDLHTEDTRNYDDAAYQIDMKKSLSAKVKMMMTGILKSPGINNVYGEFGGLKEFMDPTQVMAVLQFLLADSRNDLKSLNTKINDKIDSNPDKFGFLGEVQKRINEASPLIQNQILNKFNSTTATMSFVDTSVDYNTGRVISRVLNANSRTPQIMVTQEFRDNFKQSELINLEDGGFTINPEEIGKALVVYDSIVDTIDTEFFNPLELVDWLGKLGVTVDKHTIFDIQKSNIANLSSFKDKFQTNGVFAKIRENLETALMIHEQVVSQGKKAPLFPLVREEVYTHTDDMGNSFSVGHLLFNDNVQQMNSLIEAETKHRIPTTTSLYLGGKSIFGFSAPNSTKTVLLELRDSLDSYHNGGINANQASGIIKDLLETAGLTGIDVDGNNPSSGNFLLQALLESSKAGELFDIDIISPDSLKFKQNGKSNKHEKGKISDLNPVDYINVITGFMNNQSKEVKMNDNSIRVRIAKMFFPTLSDASDLFVVNSVIRDLDTDTVLVNEQGVVEGLSTDIKQHLANNLVYTELSRIIKFKKAQDLDPNFSLNVAGQNIGSRFILGVQGINTLKIDPMDGGTSVTYIEQVEAIIKNNIKSSPEEIMRKVQEQLGEITEDFMEDLAMYEKEKLLKTNSEGNFEGEWVNKGVVSNDGVSRVLDTKYLQSKGEQELPKTQIDIAATDYVVNNLVAQSNIQGIFAGDMSNYVNKENKHIDKFEVDSNGHIDISSIKTTGEEVSFEARQKAMSDAIYQLTEDLSVNRSKRMKALLSPGLKNANSYNEDYLQVFLSDVISVSEHIEDLIDLHYPGKLDAKGREDLKSLISKQEEIEKEQGKVRPDKGVIKKLTKEIKNLNSGVKAKFPKVKDFLEINGTDAQEYTTWREHLKILMDKGTLDGGNYTTEEVQKIYQKIEKYEESDYKGTLKLSEKEKQIVFQPLKPLHAGTYFEDAGGDFKNSVFVYVKSSSFPLIPGVTKNTKLDNLRKNLEKLEREKGIPVRASYSSANKVGGTLTQSSTHTLSDNELSTEDLLNFTRSSSKVLKRKFFSIQQDKTFKADKNLKAGKRNEVSMGVQPERVLLSNGINKMKAIFDPMGLNSKLLNAVGVALEGGKLSGPSLYKVYNHLYEKQQKLLTEKIYRDFASTNGSWNGDVDTMENLRDILLSQVDQPQAQESLELLYQVEKIDPDTGVRTLYEVTHNNLQNYPNAPISAKFKVPLWLNNNTHNFESALNSLVTNRLARLKMNGFSSPVGSSNKFDFKGEDQMSAEDVSETVYLPNYKGGKLAYTTTKDGKVTHAQVLIASRFPYKKNVGTEANPVYKEVYADLTQAPYSTVDENGVRRLNMDKFDPDLLKHFSFRTPYSAHQSGAVIEVAGFLPHGMGDLMIVPSEHTVQIGEDYDIDVRTAYSYNLESYKDKDGDIAFRRLQEKPARAFPSKSEMKIRKNYNKKSKELKEFAETLKEKYKELDTARVAEIKMLRAQKKSIKVKLQENPTDEELIEQKDEINLKLDKLDSKARRDKNPRAQKRIDKLLQNMLNELDNFSNKALDEAADDMTGIISKEKHDLKILENQIQDIYHSVYSNPAPEIRRLVSMALNTDKAEGTVKAMEKAKNREAGALSSIIEESRKFFTPYAISVQQSIMESGLAGKLGIGVHSLWVTFNALTQQLPNPIEVSFGVLNKEITIGNFGSFVPQLGRTNALTNQLNSQIEARSIAEINMENQNVATDNQKLLFMAMRNENEFTINAFALMCNMGIDMDMYEGQEVHIPSLLISQPILHRFVEMKQANKSLSNTKFMSDEEIYSKLFEELSTQTSADLGDLANGFVVQNGTQMEIPMNFPHLTAQNLMDNISGKENNALLQAQALHLFREVSKKANEVSAHQGLMKLGSSGMGISHFNTIAAQHELKNISFDEKSLEGISQLYGEFNEFEVSPEDLEQRKEELNESNTYIYKTEKNPMTGDIRLYTLTPSNFAATKMASVLQVSSEFIGNIMPYEQEGMREILDEIFEESNLFDPDVEDQTKRQFTGKGLKMMYTVMSSLKDYLYATNASNFYAGPVKEERQRLFISEGKDISQQSLSGYLQKLRANPEWKGMFEGEFFKDLTFDPQPIGTVSRIIYNASSRGTFEVDKIYNHLNNLYDMKVNKLPPFKGDEEYTFHKLVMDLARYSTLAGEEGGAIGFRHLTPMRIMESTGFNRSLRLFENISKNPDGFNKRFSLVGGGRLRYLLGDLGVSFETFRDKISRGDEELISYPIPYAEGSEDFKNVENNVSLLNRNYGSEMFTIDNGNVVIKGNVDIELYKSNFIDQFLRHNTEFIKSISDVMLGKSAETITYRDSVLETSPKEISGFTLKPESAAKFPRKSNYLKMNIAGKEVIFRKSGELSYERVDKLGSFGFNEYDTMSSAVSTVKENNNWREDPDVQEKLDVFDVYDTEGLFGETRAQGIGQTMEALFEDNTLSVAIDYLLEADQVSKNFIDELKTMGLLDNKGPVEFVDFKGKANGRYLREGETVVMDEITHTGPKILLDSIFFNGDSSDSFKAQVLAEELVHQAVSGHIDNYFDNDSLGFNEAGEMLYNYKNPDEVLPDHVMDLVDVYSKAVSAIIDQTAKDFKITREEAAKKVHEATMAHRSGNSVLGQSPAELKLRRRTYRLTNLHEFTAGLTTSKDFREDMAKVDSGGDPIKFQERVKNLLMYMFNSMGELIGKSPLTEKGVDAFLNFLDKEVQLQGPAKVIEDQDLDLKDVTLDLDPKDYPDNTLWELNSLNEAYPDRVSSNFLDDAFYEALDNWDTHAGMKKLFEKINKVC